MAMSCNRTVTESGILAISPPPGLDSRKTPRSVIDPDMASYIARSLDDGTIVHLRTSELGLSVTASKRLCVAVVDAVLEEWRARWSIPGLSLEVDRPQMTVVPANAKSRVLLPHHDGHHCSYLTPSTLHCTQFDPVWRRFGSDFKTTDMHKMFQGFHVTNPGEALSVTTYYNFVAMLADAFGRIKGRPSSDVVELARFCGANLRRAMRTSRHGAQYLSIAAILGSTNIDLISHSGHYAHEVLASNERSDGSCRLISGADWFELLTREVFGLTTDRFRKIYETQVTTERGDMLIANNITLLHGGMNGGRSRVIEPICGVIREPRGRNYEEWLAHVWSAAWMRAANRSAHDFHYTC